MDTTTTENDAPQGLPEQDRLHVEQRYAAYEKTRRFRMASMLELAGAGLVASVIFAVELAKAPPGFLFPLLLTKEPVLAAGAGLFLEMFSIILTGQGLLVLIVTQRNFLLPFFGKLDVTSIVEEIAKTRLASPKAERKDVPSDPIEAQFHKSIQRSAELVAVAQRRPNALLFAGTIVSAIGLALFMATLPGLLYPLTEIDTSGAHDIANRVLELTPRLLMLVFIQVLAGFFLRQYRTSMEELRYYETVLRYREDQLLSYMAIRDKGDKLVAAFAEKLSQHRDFIKIQQGETSLVLEAQKSETNEFKGVVNDFFDFLKTWKPGSGDAGGTAGRQ